MEEYVVLVKPVPPELSSVNLQVTLQNKVPNFLRDNKSNQGLGGHVIKEHGEFSSEAEIGTSSLPNSRDIMRHVNELSNFLRSETIRSLNDPTVKLQKFIDTEYFSRGLETRLIQFGKGREFLNGSVIKEISRENIPKLEKYFKRKIDKIRRQDLLYLQNEELSKIIGIKNEEAQKLKLKCMGVQFTNRQSSKNLTDR
jgi:hypothetical protein